MNMGIVEFGSIGSRIVYLLGNGKKQKQQDKSDICIYYIIVLYLPLLCYYLQYSNYFIFGIILLAYIYKYIIRRVLKMCMHFVK